MALHAAFVNRSPVRLLVGSLPFRWCVVLSAGGFALNVQTKTQEWGNNTTTTYSKFLENSPGCICSNISYAKTAF